MTRTDRGRSLKNRNISTYLFHRHQKNRQHAKAKRMKLTVQNRTCSASSFECVSRCVSFLTFLAYCLFFFCCCFAFLTRSCTMLSLWQTTESSQMIYQSTPIRVLQSKSVLVQMASLNFLCTGERKVINCA